MPIDMEQVVKMRVQGMSLEQIGNHFGYSKQHISAELNKFCNQDSRKSCVHKKIVYPKISDFAQFNNFNFTDMAKIMGCCYPSAMKKLTGFREMTKKEIDKLIEATGLSYDELFAKATP